MSKLLLTLILFTLVTAPYFMLVATPVLADANNLLWGGKQENVKTTVGLGEKDPRIMVAEFVKIFLGFLGLIALILILIGGFKWMLSGGNEEKVGDAKKMIVAAAIGLLIILASYGITTFVIGVLYNATNAQG